jgi:hypothetical protein
LRRWQEALLQVDGQDAYLPERQADRLQTGVAGGTLRRLRGPRVMIDLIVQYY